jgi:hypothetical protein
MRYNLRLYMVASALLALPLVALAQKDTPTTTTEAVPPIRVEEKGDSGLTFDWQLRPRTPIQFTPFEMVDPNTGKPVNANDIIEVGGVKMTAGEFYRRLNETEQWLNAHGYSLRTDTVFEYYSPQLEMELADSEKRLRDLEAQLPLSGEPAGGISILRRARAMVARLIRAGSATRCLVLASWGRAAIRHASRLHRRLCRATPAWMDASPASSARWRPRLLQRPPRPTTSRP